MKGKSFIFLLSITILLSGSCGKKASPLPKVSSPSYVINDLSGEVKDGVLFLSFSLPADRFNGGEMEGFILVREEKRQKEKGLEKRRDVKIDSKGVVTFYKERLYFFEDDLIPGITYTYRVFPYLKGGSVLGSSNPFSITWKSPPEPVSGIEIKIEDHGVEISWRKEEGYFYNVYRYRKGSYALVPLNERPLDLPSYRDTDIQEEGSYMYEVRKIKKEGDFLLEGEGKTFEVTFVPRGVPPVPYDVRAQRKEEGIYVSWEVSKKNGIKAFHVYRYSNGNKEMVAEIPASENTFLDRTPPKSRYLIYTIRSVSYSGSESEDSNSALVYMKED